MSIYRDKDGYPTSECINLLHDWDQGDLIGCMNFLREVWWPDDDYIQEEDGQWHVATVGWSGNEEVIHALKENHLWWWRWWYSTTRGGGYVFGKETPK